MPYTNGDGTYHESRRCRRLHNTGNRIRRIDETRDRDPCGHCVETDGEKTMAERDIEQMIELGICPWCEDEYTSVGRHASAAHPDQWEAYKNA